MFNINKPNFTEEKWKKKTFRPKPLFTISAEKKDKKKKTLNHFFFTSIKAVVACFTQR